jgi:GMP synthase (glutamine-hydrolysing)
MMTNIHNDKILILDFGAQYTQLIARRIREIGVYCEIWAWDHDPAEIAAFGAKGIILSGGPESTTEAGSPRAPQQVFESGVPVLGICYGMQTMAMQLGGMVEGGHHREFGYAEVEVTTPSALLDGLQDNAGAARALDVWMSHGDRVTALPSGFNVIARTAGVPIIAMADEARAGTACSSIPKSPTPVPANDVAPLRGGHLRLPHTVDCRQHHRRPDRPRARAGRRRRGRPGPVRRRRFVGRCRAAAQGDRRQLTCVFVDTGLLRWNEGDQVMAMFAQNMGVKVLRVNAADRYFDRLRGVEDPEAKRKIIGNLFVEIFDEESQKLANAKWLAQGTIYPDVIESAGSKTGKAHVIKSHHNVGGLPEHMKLGLVEPLRELFKDEVRRSALNSACRATWSTAIRSRARAWACASSAR